MKNTKKIALTIMATTAILTLGVTNVSAMGNGQGQGNLGGYGLYNSVTSEEKTKLQSLSGDDRTEYMNELREKYNVTGSRGQGMGQGKGNGQGQGQGRGQGNGQGQANQSGHDQNPANLIADIAKSDVSDSEKEFLINQYGEEKMARDLYAYAASKYDVNTFSNISKSEQKHMDTLKVLLDRYNIFAPTDYAADNELYNTLKDKIDLSEKDAIEVGIMVEKVDIDNILADTKATDNDDFKIIFTNIGGASYNHLRGFINTLDNNGYTTDISYGDYLTQDEINTRGNGLKTKLAEKLETEGVSLPKQASSSFLKENCNNNEGNNYNARKNQENRNNISNSRNYSQLETKKAQYKTLLNTKYKATIDALGEDKLKLILPKIDTLEEKVRNSTTYTDDKKESTMALLEAFREIIQERLDDTDINIDDLLN